MQTLVLLVPPLLIFISLYAGIVKLAARLLRYKLSWKLSFLFAIAMLIVAITSRAVQFAIGSLIGTLVIPNTPSRSVHGCGRLVVC